MKISRLWYIIVIGSCNAWAVVITNSNYWQFGSNIVAIDNRVAHVIRPYAKDMQIHLPGKILAAAIEDNKLYAVLRDKLLVVNVVNGKTVDVNLGVEFLAHNAGIAVDQLQQVYVYLNGDERSVLLCLDQKLQIVNKINRGGMEFALQPVIAETKNGMITMVAAKSGLAIIDEHSNADTVAIKKKLRKILPISMFNKNVADNVMLLDDYDVWRYSLLDRKISFDATGVDDFLIARGLEQNSYLLYVKKKVVDDYKVHVLPFAVDLLSVKEPFLLRMRGDNLILLSAAADDFMVYRLQYKNSQLTAKQVTINAKVHRYLINSKDKFIELFWDPTTKQHVVWALREGMVTETRFTLDDDRRLLAVRSSLYK